MPSTSMSDADGPLYVVRVSAVRGAARWGGRPKELTNCRDRMGGDCILRGKI